MKLAWNDVKPYFEEQTVWVNNQDIYWYQYVWQLLDENNLTVCNSLVEKLAVYSRVYATVKIYREFCSVAFGENPYFDLYLDKLTSDEEKQDIYDKLIEDSGTMQTIFDLLKEKLGREITYYSMWITCCSEDFEIEFSTYENYSDALSEIMNENYSNALSGIMNENLSINKLASYEWLTKQM